VLVLEPTWWPWRDVDRHLLHHGGMADPADLNDVENWSGGWYELAIELGPKDDRRLERTLQAVWREVSAVGSLAPELQPRRNRKPWQWSGHPAVGLSLGAPGERGHLRGVVRLPGGQDVICGVAMVREDDGSDWLDFYIPMGALGRADSRIGGYPFGDDGGPSSLAWRRPIDDWLADVAKRVYASVPFQLALIGCEASGKAHADEISNGASGPSYVGYLVPVDGALRYQEATT
jgi:hypothetical protein